MINKMQLGEIFHAFTLPRKYPTVQVVFFETPKKVFRVTRKLYHGKICKNHLELVVTYGKPNFRERNLLKKLGWLRSFVREYALVKGKKVNVIK
jgi:hypothetical protein